VGETDLSVEDQLIDVLDAAVDAAEIGVRIDMADVRFVDSCGLRTLVRARRRAARGGRQFAIRPASAVVTRVLQVSGLDDLLVTEPGRAPSTTRGRALRSVPR
jgi:anti-sigma B factor antagonist